MTIRRKNTTEVQLSIDYRRETLRGGVAQAEARNTDAYHRGRRVEVSITCLMDTIMGCLT